MSQTCQWKSQKSLDHLVGLCEHSRRHLNAERFRGLEVDGEFVLGRLLNRQPSDRADIFASPVIWESELCA